MGRRPQNNLIKRNANRTGKTQIKKPLSPGEWERKLELEHKLPNKALKKYKEFIEQEIERIEKSGREIDYASIDTISRNLADEKNVPYGRAIGIVQTYIYTI